jgi:hypothetical protein
MCGVILILPTYVLISWTGTIVPVYSFFFFFFFFFKFSIQYSQSSIYIAHEEYFSMSENAVCLQYKNQTVDAI